VGEGGAVRKQWSVDEKLAIVLEGLKGEVSVAEVCRKHGLQPKQYYLWRDRLLEGGKRALDGGGRSEREAELEGRIEELQQVIGKLAVEVEALKKSGAVLPRLGRRLSN